MTLDIIHARRLAGRCLNGGERDGGRRVHAVALVADRALCGAKPGRLSAGWSDSCGQWSDGVAADLNVVTCPRCRAGLLRKNGGPP